MVPIALALLTLQPQLEQALIVARPGGWTINASIHEPAPAQNREIERLIEIEPAVEKARDANREAEEDRLVRDAFEEAADAAREAERQQPN
ncbi:MAG: hypothetical protein ACT4OE_08415 [Sphingosinicella sp.]